MGQDYYFANHVRHEIFAAGLGASSSVVAIGHGWGGRALASANDNR